MTDPCRDWRGALGAAALGRIDPAEEVAFRAHLDGCADCRAELQELTTVAQALTSMPVSNVIGPPAEPSGELAGRVLDRVARERRTRHGRRVRRAAGGVTAFAGAAAAAIALVFALSGGGSSGTRVVLTGAGGARAVTTLHAEPAGTELDVTVSGLKPGQYYWMWLTGSDEHRIPAGTFEGGPAPNDMRLTAAVPLAKARRVWVTDQHDHVVLDGFLKGS